MTFFCSGSRPPLQLHLWVSSLYFNHTDNRSSNAFPSICPGWPPTCNKLPCLLAKEHISYTGQQKHHVLDEVLGHLALRPPRHGPASVHHCIWVLILMLHWRFLPKSSRRLWGCHPWVTQAQIHTVNSHPSLGILTEEGWVLHLEP